jgi:uncharacterized protein YndB with AHSA1/START domain
MTPVGSQAEELTDASHDGALAVDVSRTVPAPLGRVWELLISREGAATWLGEGAALGGKGEPYHCADGSSGVVRSYHPLEQLRVSWHETPDSAPSIVEIELSAQDGGTLIQLQHVHLHHDPITGAEHAALQSRWSSGLDALAARAAG